MRYYFVPNHRFWIILGLMLVLLFIAAPAMAQDVAPVFTPPTFPDTSNAFVTAVLAIFASALASPLTAPLVSLIKRIPLVFIQNLPADTLNLIVAVVLSSILWLGQAIGHAADVDTAYRLIFALLPFISSIGANYFSNQAIYARTKGKMPLVGYARPQKAITSPTA